MFERTKLALREADKGEDACRSVSSISAQGTQGGCGSLAGQDPDSLLIDSS